MDFIKDRLKERTSLDGVVAIGGGIVMILIPTSLIGWGLIACRFRPILKLWSRWNCKKQ